MTDDAQSFPDVSAILARKAEWRRERAGLSFGEKLDILDAMRERYAPFVKLRERAAADRKD
jgi:hypothetical protein